MKKVIKTICNDILWMIEVFILTLNMKKRKKQMNEQVSKKEIF
jgi:hypothetical protein